MAGKRTPRPPLSPEDRAELLDAIRNSSAPLTALQLYKLLPVPRKVRTAEIAPILEEFVAGGVLHRIPPPTPKGKPSYWDRDVRAIARSAALEALHRADGPLTAADLAKRIGGPLKFKEGDLTPVLDECVADGQLHAFPPVSAKKKPRYWDRDLNSEIRSVVLEALRGAKGPLLASDLTKPLKSAIKITPRELASVLDECVKAGTVFVIPASGAKGKPRYSDRSPLEVARLGMLQLLAAKGPQTPANLRKSVKWLSDAQFAQLFQDLRAARELLPQPPVGTSRGELFGNRPPSPGPYLKKLGTELAKVVEKLTTAGVAHDDLRRALVELIEAAGVPFGTTGTSPGTSAPPPRADSFDLIALIKRLEPGAERGALVGARDLRRAAGLGKSAFDSAVLELSRQGRVSLHRHDYPASLTPQERDELVTDGAGTYYVGLALRQTGGTP